MRMRALHIMGLGKGRSRACAVFTDRLAAFHLEALFFSPIVPCESGRARVQ